MTITAEPTSPEKPLLCANCGRTLIPANVAGGYAHGDTQSVVCFAGEPRENA